MAISKLTRLSLCTLAIAGAAQSAHAISYGRSLTVGPVNLYEGPNNLVITLSNRTTMNIWSQLYVSDNHIQVGNDIYIELAERCNGSGTSCPSHTDIRVQAPGWISTQTGKLTIRHGLAMRNYQMSYDEKAGRLVITVPRYANKVPACNCCAYNCPDCCDCCPYNCCDAACCGCCCR